LQIQFKQNQNFDQYNASSYARPCYSTKFYLKNGVREGTVVVLRKRQVACRFAHSGTVAQMRHCPFPNLEGYPLAIFPLPFLS